MNTRKMLDLNTEHLKEDSFPILEDLAIREINGEETPIRVLTHKYGFIIYPTDPECLQEHSELIQSLPYELLEINKAAYDQGCIVINFDSDAEYHDQFTVFNG